MSSDLVVWLKRQLDDDGRVAPRVHSEDCALHAWLRFDVPSACDCGWPARVLRDVEADRKILDWHSPVRYELIPVAQCEYCAGLCHSQSGLGCDSPDAPYPCDTIRLLALPYCDRPGYQEAWRP